MDETMDSPLQHILVGSDATAARKKMSDLFRIGRRFPEMVFQSSFDNFAFLDYGCSFDASFWNVLKWCALKAADHDVYMWSDALEVLPATAGTNAIMKMHAASEGSLYEKYRWVPMPVGLSESDNIGYNTSVEAWWGSSGKWAIWGEHGFNMLVCASCGPLINWIEFNMAHTEPDILDADEALEFCISRLYKTNIVPADIRQEFLHNYKSNI